MIFPPFFFPQLLPPLGAPHATADQHQRGGRRGGEGGGGGDESLRAAREKRP